MYLDSKNEHPGQDIQNFRAQTGHTDTLSCFYDLDLDSVTLIYHFDLDILSRYTSISKMNFLAHVLTVSALGTDTRNTGATRNITKLHLGVVIILYS